MKIKFNKFERVAGLFVGIAFIMAVLGGFGMAIKKGWLSSKVEYVAKLESADGIHEGTIVQISGLRAGAVVDVDLVSAQEVNVKFEVMEKYQTHIRGDSRIQVLRPFVIGEKLLEVSIGSNHEPMMKPGSLIPVETSFDLMDVFSGKKMGPFLGTLEGLSSNLKMLADAFSDSKRTKAFLDMFDRMSPLVRNLNTMAIDVTKVTKSLNQDQRLDKLVSSLAALTEQLNEVMPEIAQQMPEMAKQIPHLVENLTVLTTEFRKVTPVISEMAPELPRVSKRAIEALDETVITLKALQKSFLLKGNVQDVREEEAKRRVPTSEEKPGP